MNWRQMAANPCAGRLASREVEILDRAELFRERHDLLEGEVGPLVELLPVEAVLALHVAQRVDEEDDERRAWNLGRRQALPVEPRVLCDALREVLHRALLETNP